MMSGDRLGGTREVTIDYVEKDIILDRGNGEIGIEGEMFKIDI